MFRECATGGVLAIVTAVGAGAQYFDSKLFNYSSFFGIFRAPLIMSVQQ
jgi:hypothetical protein